MGHPLTDEVQRSLGSLGFLESYGTKIRVKEGAPSIEQKDGAITVQIPPNTPVGEIDTLLFDLTDIA